jgi:adenosine deaminase
MQTELHRHMDVSMRISTFLNLAQERGLEPQSTSVESFYQKIVLKQPLKDLSAVLTTFTLCQKILDRPEVLERVAFEVIEDCWNEGTRKAELRYSPSFVSEYNQLNWNDVLDAFEQGAHRALKKYPEMKAGLICIASRDYGSDAVEESIEFYLKNFHRFIGFDLAGNEKEFPCRLYQSSFQKALKKGAKITVHAGEGSGPENIWEAIDLLGAQRIGHGIAAIQDPLLMKTLAEKHICLEVCPTSNWLTSAVPSLKEHPLPKLLRAGVPVSINTDDPAIFGVTLPHEIQVCRQEMGMTEQEIDQCQSFASRASFIPN